MKNIKCNHKTQIELYPLAVYGEGPGTYCKIMLCTHCNMFSVHTHTNGESVVVYFKLDLPEKSEE